MLSQILFLRALLTHIDRLQALLGEQWPNFQARLNELLDQVRSETNEGALPARVNRIYRCFEGTLAEALCGSPQRASSGARIAPQAQGRPAEEISFRGEDLADTHASNQFIREMPRRL